jgi:phenylalanyl-tRNA synthetase beta chain
MKISYNWLKWYIPDMPPADKLVDVFNYHICEVENVEKIPDKLVDSGEDTIFDLNILPNRAHDLLSHQGVARELASFLNIKFIDPKYKIPESKPTKLIKKIESPKCRRYMGRIVRNIKIGPSPDWVIADLEAMGQRSINNIVDATNIVMYDCGQPAHVFDLKKVKNLKLKVRLARNDEKITLLNGEEKVLNDTMVVISDEEGNSLDIAGVKGGKYAELNAQTTNIILEIANFDPVSVRKTAQALNIVTGAKKRFENDLSPELGSFAMRELSALIQEMCPQAIFEEIVDIYPKKQGQRKLSFSAGRISKILGLAVSADEIKNILKRYDFKYNLSLNPSPAGRGAGGKVFEIIIPPLRLDLAIEEDMAEEVGRIIGYDKIKGKIPKISFKPKVNETYSKILWARDKLLKDGYSEVMTYAFCDRGEAQVLASASDKKFLRSNLADGLKESLKLNKINAPLLGLNEVRIFEIGTIFTEDDEEIHVAYNEGDKVIEKKLDEFKK